MRDSDSRFADTQFAQLSMTPSLPEPGDVYELSGRYSSIRLFCHLVLMVVALAPLFFLNGFLLAGAIKLFGKTANEDPNVAVLETVIAVLEVLSLLFFGCLLVAAVAITSNELGRALAIRNRPTLRISTFLAGFVGVYVGWMGIAWGMSNCKWIPVLPGDIFHLLRHPAKETKVSPIDPAGILFWAWTIAQVLMQSILASLVVPYCRLTQHVYCERCRRRARRTLHVYHIPDRPGTLGEALRACDYTWLATLRPFPRGRPGRYLRLSLFSCPECRDLHVLYGEIARKYEAASFIRKRSLFPGIVISAEAVASIPEA